MKKVVVVGSLNVDLVTTVEKTVQVGQTVFGQGLSKLEGGKGANQAVAIAKLGGDVAMVGMVGEDEFGEMLRQSLEKHGVGTNYIKTTSKAPTGTALIMVEKSGDNSIVVISGANFELSGADIDKSAFEGAEYVVSQFEVPYDTILKSFKMAKSVGAVTVLNPAPARDIDDELLSYTDVIVPNQTEFEVVTGVKPETYSDIETGAKFLFDKGVSEVIVTLGAKGAVYLNKFGSSYEVSSYSVDAVDTTAAGDSFIGGLITKLASGEEIEDAIEYAMRVGAVTVTRCGAQVSLPTSVEIEEFKGVKKDEKG